ncbi:phosphopantothenate--cysteine ligase [Vagococcus xieshaowenii]|uniref:Phosphopantothenate--cysteine ligase n=1 Tax=Vagococcus xieshaowenii TaxID=2562451 RepID=A0A4Z0D6Z3_9ENTE|nr:phosphopantothenate--cysteine ligase [Vagococcus xieshaowenii]QCA28543.1 phosphopantothenate--cysteine ligase [Vagococcus xieshaowenii]TFZ40649.1 phosphopantothenate--cysteine ligase [Vagococcus xieshaowenii]
MRILVTAGGTKEKIDDVRYIANHSTGRLGSIIADSFAQDENNHVTYIHGYGAILPQHKNIKVVPIFTSQELEIALKKELETYAYDIVIHSMAVSDYTMDNAFSQDDLLNSLSDALFNNSNEITKESFEQLSANVLSKLGKENEDKKLSSSNEHLILRLKKTPKIIKMIKEIQPNTTLVGFKLLVDVSEEHLLTIAHQLLEKNDCDYVLANDLTSIEGDQHTGYLVAPDKQLRVAHTKPEIAKLIKQTLSYND